MPPKLSSGALLWWGVGLIVVSVVASYALQRAFGLYSSEAEAFFFATFGPVLSAMIVVAQFLGAAFVAVSFGVRALGSER